MSATFRWNGNRADITYSPDDGGWYWSDHQTDRTSDKVYGNERDCQMAFARWVELKCPA